MKIKQKIITALIISIFGLVLNTGFVSAIEVEETNTSTTSSNTAESVANDDNCENLGENENCVGGVKTSIINISCGGTDNIEDSCVWVLLITGINIMTAGIGILAVGGIVYGGILYATSDGNTNSTAKAIKTIQNVVIGILAYALMFSFLNFIIPGGMF